MGMHNLQDIAEAYRRAWVSTADELAAAERFIWWAAAIGCGIGLMAGFALWG